MVKCILIGKNVKGTTNANTHNIHVLLGLYILSYYNSNNNSYYYRTDI